MKQMTLRETQLMSLEILKDVHNFCVDNNIRYTLGYGTLIGAIRHKGFIPWDDDIDILLPRPDYDRFCKSFKSKCGYKLYAPENNDSYLNYARVCDIEKTYVLGLPWCKRNTGVWIDIFPIDGINEYDNRENDKAILKKIFDQQVTARRPLGKLDLVMPKTKLIKLIIKKILFCWTNIHPLIERYMKLARRVDYSEAKLVGSNTILTYYTKDVHPKHLFDSYRDVNFEGCLLKSISDYDVYLTKLYGDYMQLPPEEKRVHHPQKMYWR